MQFRRTFADRLQNSGDQCREFLAVLRRFPFPPALKNVYPVNNGPWVTHWEEMAKKTAIRRLFKYLPVSIEIQRAVSMDEKETLTIDPADASVITGEYSVVENAGVEENVTA